MLPVKLHVLNDFFFIAKETSFTVYRYTCARFYNINRFYVQKCLIASLHSAWCNLCCLSKGAQ